MPKGFVKLNRRAGNLPEHVYRIAVDQVARYGDYSTPHAADGSYVVLKTLDEGNNETLYVRETPDELDALIDAEQHGTPQRSEFAEAMGHALLGGAR